MFLLGHTKLVIGVKAWYNLPTYFFMKIIGTVYATYHQS